MPAGWVAVSATAALVGAASVPAEGSSTPRATAVLVVAAVALGLAARQVAGWEVAGRRPAGDDERRRYYRLTPLGRRVLAAEMRRLRQLVRLAEERRLIAPEPA